MTKRQIADDLQRRVGRRFALRLLDEAMGTTKYHEGVARSTEKRHPTSEPNRCDELPAHPYRATTSSHHQR